jgi:hypothetical protein
MLGRPPVPYCSAKKLVVVTLRLVSLPCTRLERHFMQSFVPPLIREIVLRRGSVNEARDCAWHWPFPPRSFSFALANPSSAGHV